MRGCKRTVTNMFADIKTIPYFYRIKKKEMILKEERLRLLFWDNMYQLGISLSLFIII